MLCQHCLKQKNCLPYQLAIAHPEMVSWLEKLKRCELYQPAYA